uniref:Uncharacterized protein n=1 Tax=Oryza brachyantha TaxID=4533 RepID=J3LBM0_ORYBR
MEFRSAFCAALLLVIVHSLHLSANASTEVMDTNLCSDDEQDHIISDEDEFAVEEVDSDSRTLVADKTKLLEPAKGKALYTSTNEFKPNPSTRQQCPAKVNFYLHGEKFCISTLTLDHNHAGFQSNHPAQPSHISSYMDLLQGKGDLTELLSQHMKE